jgi:hypothetical protein
MNITDVTFASKLTGPTPQANARKGNSLKVRVFEESDIPRVREIMVQHHATTVFRDQRFSDWKLNRHFETILSRPPGMICITAELGGAAAGVAWAAADSYMLSDGPLFITVHVIAVDLALGPVRRAKIFLSLIGGIRQWAASLNASHSFIHVTTGSSIKATDRLMKAAGAAFVGGAYVV